jgi:hypothetical protein
MAELLIADCLGIQAIINSSIPIQQPFILQKTQINQSKLLQLHSIQFFNR